MNTHVLSLAASLVISLGGAALAQPVALPVSNQAAPYSAVSSAVGRWVYDLQGNKIGSVRSLSGDGRNAIIMVGSYFQSGSHEARVPSNALSLVNGKVTLQAGTLEAANTVAGR